MKKKLFVGIDPSLTGTGVFILFGDKTEEFKTLELGTKPHKFNSSISRCLHIVDKTIDFIEKELNDDYEIGMICCEDYFSGRNPDSVIKLAELGTLIRYKLLMKGYPFFVVAPKSLKKFITGNGNAKKNVIIKSVFTKWGYNLSSDNVADASGLANFAKTFYRLQNEGEIELFKYEKEVFEKYNTNDCLLKL